MTFGSFVASMGLAVKVGLVVAEISGNDSLGDFSCVLSAVLLLAAFYACSYAIHGSAGTKRARGEKEERLGTVKALIKNAIAANHASPRPSK
jgi:hypothetical protein